MSRASRAHSFLVALRAFAARIDAAAAPAAPATLAVLRRLFALFALYWLERDMGDFVEDGFVRAAQADAVRAEVRALLDELRPDACALTDAWDFRDFVLQSAIGRYDGDVYPALFESATRSVLNQAPRGPGSARRLRRPRPITRCSRPPTTSGRRARRGASSKHTLLGIPSSSLWLELSLAIATEVHS